MKKKGGKRGKKERKRRKKGRERGERREGKGGEVLVRTAFFWEHVHNVLKKSSPHIFFLIKFFILVLVKRRVIYFNKKALLFELSIQDNGYHC